MKTTVRDTAWETPYTVVIVIAAAVPWLIAVLPLAFNGVQQVQESGHTGDGSVGLGVTMLAMAALPVVAALSVLAFGRVAGVPPRRVRLFSVAALLLCGVASFLFASLLAMA
ncbi:hypothetical protein [Peterkaempfera bronchialis]|uniref:hypothetical protein n=1 Tax=Peterkaempfera bronchialis TaxID=2126346 RepID=UPI003C2CEC62